VAVYTAAVMVVHHHMLSGATTIFSIETREGEGVTAMMMAVHRPIFPERAPFSQRGGVLGAWLVVTTTPTVVPPPPLSSAQV
jgi:hypothetical protein